VDQSLSQRGVGRSRLEQLQGQYGSIQAVDGVIRHKTHSCSGAHFPMFVATAELPGEVTHGRGRYQVPWPSGSLHASRVPFATPLTQLTELA